MHIPLINVDFQLCDLNYLTVPDDPLDKPPNPRDLLSRVASEAKSKWRHVGIELGINKDNLDVISEEKDPFDRYSKVFSQWEKKADPNFPFTWRTVVNTLRSPIVEENSLAMKIENWLQNNLRC